VILKSLLLPNNSSILEENNKKLKELMVGQPKDQVQICYDIMIFTINKRKNLQPSEI
jgi:hypothetical protein